MSGSWHISSPWLRLDGFPHDCKLLTTATAWPTVEGQSSRKHQMGSVNERFPREAKRIEIWWSRLVDGKELVCPFVGTFVMIVGALVTWAIYTQGKLLLWSSLIVKGVVGINSPGVVGINSPERSCVFSHILSMWLYTPLQRVPLIEGLCSLDSILIRILTLRFTSFALLFPEGKIMFKKKSC